jgi:hypothetical protein
MKAIFLLLPALVVSVPAHALSIVSLHGGMSPPISASTVDAAIIVGSVLALAAVLGFRVFFRH